jgi:hypothetical protein
MSGMVRFVSKDLKYVSHENKNVTKVGLLKNYTIIYFFDQQNKRQIAIYDWSGTESTSLTLKSFQQESLDIIRWYISGYVNTKGNVNYIVQKLWHHKGRQNPKSIHKRGGMGFGF